MKKYIISIIAVLIILFCVSSMSYEQQTIVPTLKKLLDDQPFYHLLSKIHVTYWGQTISVETRGYFYFIEFLVRKGLHFVGFGMIGILFYQFYRKFKLNLAAIYAILSTFVLASLDELRQTFVAGRTGVFQDVLLDTSGALCFVFLFKIILIILNKRLKLYRYSNFGERG